MLSLSFFFVNCSDDDDNSNPTDPPAEVEGVGIYVGTTSNGKEITLEISDVNGEAWLTRYDFEFSDLKGGAERSSTQGIVQIVDNSFLTQIGSTASEVLSGTLNNSTITGSYNINTIVSDTGTYTATKQ